MVSIATVFSAALSFPETDEHPHFDRTAFRVKKKIFATLPVADHTLNLRLTPADQFIYCKADPVSVIPVPNAWGKQGWTTINLKKIKISLFKEMLEKAFLTAAPVKTARQYRQQLK